MELVTKLHGANWIGLSDHLNEKIEVRKNQIVFYKHTFNLSEPGNMAIHISAHNRYKLWINNERVTKGPCKGDPWRHYYETVDVSKYLKTGENIISAEVAYYPPNQLLNDHSGGSASLFTNVFGPWMILKGICFDCSGNELVNISTGTADWYIHLSNAYKWNKYESTTYVVVGDFEELTGNLIPKNWRIRSDYDSFEKAKINWRADGTYFGELLPFTLNARPIPLLLDIKHSFSREMPIYSDTEHITFSHENKVHLKPNRKYVIELDAMELMTGYLNIKTNAGLGSKIVITYAESYSKESKGQYPEKGVRDDARNYSLNGYQDIYYPTDSKFIYEPFWYRTFRFIKIEVQVGAQPMEIYSPYYYETGYPLEVKSSIETNATWTKELWNISIRTMKRCMHETYYDCPYYEQLQYLLDTRLEILFTYSISDDLRLPIKAIEDFHASLLPSGQLMCRYPSASRHVMPVFSLQWILMLNDYYQHTGKTDLIIRYRPAIDAILAWFDRKMNKSNLVEKFGHWHFVDWVEEWENEEGIATGTPNAAAHGPLTFDNLVLIRTLKVASDLMSLTGRTGAAKEYLERAAIIETSVNNTCFDEKTGLYMDGPGFFEFSQHCQVWAVLSGVAKEELQKNILRNSINKPEIAQCSYAGSYFLFRAFEKAGIYEETWPLWHNWKQLLTLNLTTWPEDLTRHRSDCHGWGSLPLYEFTRHILGITADSPGYESVIINPSFTGLNQAKGQVVTPKGIIEIQWKKSANGIIINGTVPIGTPCKLVIDGKIAAVNPEGGTIYFNSTVK